MKFFLDTANINEIREGISLGIVDGVTTNPSLVAKEGKGLEEVAREICELVDGPVSLEVVSTKSPEIITEARHLSKIHPNVVVKIPMIREGLKALNIVAQEGIRVNITVVFSATQALLAAKNGATFVSPFLGRLDDVSLPGMSLISDIVKIYNNYHFDTEVLAASIRSPLHVLEAAKLGAHIATIPSKVMEQLIAHPFSDIALKKFLADWEKQNPKN